MEEHDIDAQGSGEALLQHADWLRRLARSLVQDAAERDDLVQETWLAALRSRVAEDRPLQPWLRSVAKNLSRRASRRREKPSADPAQGKIDPGLPDPSDVAEKLEAERRLTEALSSLEEPFRTALFLRFYEDLSSPEIAKRTNSPAGTVRWRLKRGLELLREGLDDEAAPGAWLGLLLPLALTGSPGSAAALAAGAGASPLLLFFGALAMNTMIKALAAALVLTLVYVGLDSTDVLPQSPFHARARRIRTCDRGLRRDGARRPRRGSQRSAGIREGVGTAAQRYRRTDRSRAQYQSLREALTPEFGSRRASSTIRDVLSQESRSQSRVSRPKSKATFKASFE